MSEELTKDHSVRRWIEKMVREKFGDKYIVHTDVYTSSSPYVMIVVELRQQLVRGQKSRPPITYKVSFEHWKDPEPVATKVMTALMLMEQSDDA